MSGPAKEEGRVDVTFNRVSRPLSFLFDLLRQFDRFRRIIDGQAMASQQHRSEQRILPVTGGYLGFVGVAEPIEEAGEHFQFDGTAIR